MVLFGSPLQYVAAGVTLYGGVAGQARRDALIDDGSTETLTCSLSTLSGDSSSDSATLPVLATRTVWRPPRAPLDITGCSAMV